MQGLQGMYVNRQITSFPRMSITNLIRRYPTNDRLDLFRIDIATADKQPLVQMRCAGSMEMCFLLLS